MGWKIFRPDVDSGGESEQVKERKKENKIIFTLTIMKKKASKSPTRQLLQ